MEEARKKIIILHILDILRKKSHDEKPLSLTEIIRELEKREIYADRKAVKRNLDDLMHANLGFEIQTTVTYKRTYTDKRTGKEIENPIHTGYYLVPEIDDQDLRYLIDSVLCSRYLTVSQKDRIIGSLKKMTYLDLRSRAKHLNTLSDPLLKNPTLLTNVNQIETALEQHKKISFQYYQFGTDKKLHVKTKQDGTPILYIINPLQIVMSNGWYYLIGNPDQYDDLSSFRIDKLANLSILEETAKPTSKIKGAEQVINPAKYPHEHIYMFNKKPEIVIFRASKCILDEIMDRFGTSATFRDETEKDVEVRVSTDPAAVRYWALQYATNVRILYPPSLADLVKADLQKALDNYA